MAEQYFAKIDTVYIPNMKAQSLEPELLADDTRTASGKMNRQLSAKKRRWKITASKLTPAERDAILGLLDSKMYGAVAFWLDSFGPETVTVQAYASDISTERVEFGKGGVWYADGCNLELTMKEQ